MTLRFTLCLLFCLGLNTASHAELYYWKAADGSMMVTDKEPPPGVEYGTRQDLPQINISQSLQPKSVTDQPKTGATDVTGHSQTSTATETVTATESELITVKLSPNAAPVEIQPASAAIAKTTDVAMPASKPATQTPAIDMNKVLASHSKEPTVLSSHLIKSNDEQHQPSLVDTTPENLQRNDEAGCQKIYGLSCDKVFNWKKYGEAYCADFKNERCSDEAWFAKRFKPLTLEQRHKNVLRNAAQTNQDNEEIRDYLQMKYTGICTTEPEKAPMRCNNKAYDAKIMETFNKLSAKDQADIRHLQQVLKTSKDRSLIARSIEKFMSYFSAGATAATQL